MTSTRRVLAAVVACLAALAPVVVAAPAPLDGGSGASCAPVAASGGHHSTSSHSTTTTRTTTPKPTTRTTTPKPTTRTTTPCPDEDVTVGGAPDLHAFAPEKTVAPGERKRFVVQLSNSGTVDDGGLDVPPEAERLVTTARTGTTGLGDLPSGSIAELGFTIDVDEDADPGVYDVPVKVRYDYTESVSGDDRDDESETEKLYVRLVVTEDARFEVVDVDEDLQVGETGTVEVTLENVGEADLTNARVRLTSPNRDLRLSGGVNATRYVGDWDAGDEETIEVEATATNGSAPQRYALRASVLYRDEDGRPGESLPLAFGVRLHDEQAFDVDDVEGDLYVGEDGTVTGEVTNEGPEPVADAVVRLVDGDGDVVARRASVVGDLDEDESEDFEIPVRVPGDAEPGERRLSFVVSYVNRDGDPRTSGRLFDTVEVGEKRDRFVVRDVDEDLQVGETGTVELSLANFLDEDVTDATVTVRSPNADLTLGGAAEATRYVGDWDSGDWETVAVEATLSPDAAAQRYPLEVTVTYTDEDGQRRTSEVLVTRVRPAREQSFDVRNVASTLRVGEEGRVNATVVNTGPREVSTAVVRLTDPGENVDPRETEAVLGTLDPGDGSRFSLPLSVLATAQPGQRRLTFVVEYVTEAGDRRTSDPISVVVRAASETDRFALTDVDADLQAGDSDDVVLTFTNRANETLTDATVSLDAAPSGVVVGGGEDVRFVGEWPANETRRVRYRVRAGNDTADQTFAFTATVAYDDAEGQSRESDPLRFGATPAPEQAFAVATVQSTLRVGEEGRVRSALTNRGPRNATVVAVELVPPGGNVNPVETEAAVGDVAAGGTTEFSLPIEVSQSADAGDRQLSYRVRYTDDDGDRRVSDVLVAAVAVAPERDPFLVEARDVNVTAGGSSELELVVTNNRGVEVRNVRAKAFADAPLSVDDSQAFVSSLAPNESTTIRFTVSADGGAAEKAYPLSVDFLYTTPDGDDELSEPVNVGVAVRSPPPSALPSWLLPALAVLVVLVALAWYVRRRRRGGDEGGEGDGGEGGGGEGPADGGDGEGGAGGRDSADTLLEGEASGGAASESSGGRAGDGAGPD